MKIIYIILQFILFPLYSYSQQLYSLSGDHYTQTKREIIDSAKICAFYDIKFLKDSTKTTEYTTAQTILMISDNYTLYGDYQRILYDSINDYMAESKKHSRNKEMKKRWLQTLDNWKYNIVALKDLNTSQIRVQIYDILRSYEYEDAAPNFAWDLLPNDSLINNIPCKKATCSYAGRKYIAWYAESIALPYGPYLFGGLPGLIVKLYDTKKNWVFTNTSVGTMSANKNMYLYKEDFIQPIIKTTRKKALDAYRNDIENYQNLSIEVFNVKVKKNGQWVTPEANNPSKSSNLLELEW